MDPMILLRRLGGPIFALNPDLIERAESTPDTVLTMVGGNKYVICEGLDELSQLILEHRARIIATAGNMGLGLDTRRPLPTSARTPSSGHLQDVSKPAPSPISSVVPIRPKDN
jgi:flagellar protein FlbD